MIWISTKSFHLAEYQLFRKEFECHCGNDDDVDVIYGKVSHDCRYLTVSSSSWLEASNCYPRATRALPMNLINVNWQTRFGVLSSLELDGWRPKKIIRSLYYRCTLFFPHFFDFFFFYYHYFFGGCKEYIKVD